MTQSSGLHALMLAGLASAGTRKDVLTQNSDSFWLNHSSKNILWNIPKGEILVITLPTTPIEIFCNIILNFHVIVKRIKYPDENDSSGSLPTDS